MSSYVPVLFCFPIRPSIHPSHVYWSFTSCFDLLEKNKIVEFSIHKIVFSQNHDHNILSLEHVTTLIIFVEGESNTINKWQN